MLLLSNNKIDADGYLLEYRHYISRLIHQLTSFHSLKFTQLNIAFACIKLHKSHIPLSIAIVSS